MKACYVVHASFFFRMAMWFLAPLLSTNVWSKVTYISCVQELFQHFQPSQLVLPEFVFKYDMGVNPWAYEKSGGADDL